MSTNTPVEFSGNARRRIVSIQVCRGIAAFAVVFCHLYNVERKYFSTHLLSLFQFGDVGVDLFFVISGVVISTVTKGKFHSTPHAWRFLYHRLTRIYPIYWMYSALVFAAYLYNPLLVNASGGHHVNVLASFLLIPTDVPMLLLQGWTLTYEVYFYLVFFVLLWFAPERLVLRLLLCWAVLILALYCFMPQAGPIGSLLMSPAILEFLAGCVIFHIYRRASLHASIGAVFLVLSALWGAGIVLWTRYAHNSNAMWIESSSASRVALYGSFAVLFLMGLMELERTRWLTFSLPLVAIGDWSYSIYLSHTIVLKFVGHAIARIAPQQSMDIVLVTAISVPAVLLSGYASFRFLERPLTDFFYKRAP